MFQIALFSGKCYVKDMSLKFFHITYLICDVIISMLDSSGVNHGFKLWLDQTKDYNIGICYFSAKHTAF